MRANPIKIREEFKSHLTDNEIIELGVNRPAGDDHYRAYVGPPFYYDINSILQFQMLTGLGLREYHRFLEIGCGSLRLGRLLIPFMLSNRYHGVEPNEKILNEGSLNNLGSNLNEGDLFNLKKPSFKISADYEYSFTGNNIDYAIAQSIASHTGLAEFKSLLKGLYDCTNETSRSIVTYIRCLNPEKENRKNGWFYPECVSYTDYTVSRLAKSVGFTAFKIGWPIINRRNDGLISTQQPLLLTKNNWEPSASDYINSGFFSSIEPLC